MTTTVPTPSPKVLFTEIDDGTGVLLHLDTKFYYTLNATGVVVWKALADRSVESSGAIAERLVAAFRVEREVAERDIEALIAELLEGGLVIAK
jgi:hypothetical protein